MIITYHYITGKRQHKQQQKERKTKEIQFLSYLATFAFERGQSIDHVLKPRWQWVATAHVVGGNQEVGLGPGTAVAGEEGVEAEAGALNPGHNPNPSTNTNVYTNLTLILTVNPN